MTPSLKRNHVTLVGNGSQTIILAHGFGTDQTAWHSQVEALAGDYRLLLFDMVGAGRSDLEAFHPKRYNSLYSYANDLIEICRDLSLKDAIYVGHSVSGIIGVLASRLQTALFARLVLIGASPRYLNDADYIGGFEPSDLAALYRSMTENYYGWVSGFSRFAMGNEDRPELARSFAATLEQVRPDIAQAVVRVIFESDHRAVLGEIGVPCAIIQANRDVAVPLTVARYLHRHIPNSRMFLLPTAEGHFPHMSSPEETVGAIRTALAG